MKIEDIKRFDIVEINSFNYIVLNIISYKDNTYFYLINEEETKNDVSIVKVTEDDKGVFFSDIKDDEEYANVLNLLLLNNTNLLQEE